MTEAVSSSELQTPKHRRWHEPQRRLEVYVAPEYLRYSKLTEKLRTLERVLGNIPRMLGSFAERTASTPHSPLLVHVKARSWPCTRQRWPRSRGRCYHITAREKVKSRGTAYRTYVKTLFHLEPFPRTPRFRAMARSASSDLKLSCSLTEQSLGARWRHKRRIRHQWGRRRLEIVLIFSFNR